MGEEGRASLELIRFCPEDEDGAPPVGHSPRRSGMSGDLRGHETEEAWAPSPRRHLLAEYQSTTPVAVTVPPKPLLKFAQASQQPLERMQARKAGTTPGKGLSGAKSHPTTTDRSRESKGSLALTTAKGPRILRLPKKQSLGGQVRKPAQGMFPARCSKVKVPTSIYSRSPGGPPGAGFLSRGREAYRAGATPAALPGKSRNSASRAA